MWVTHWPHHPYFINSQELKVKISRFALCFGYRSRIEKWWCFRFLRLLHHRHNLLLFALLLLLLRLLILIQKLKPAAILRHLLTAHRIALIRFQRGVFACPAFLELFEVFVVVEGGVFGGGAWWGGRRRLWLWWLWLFEFRGLRGFRFYGL